MDLAGISNLEIELPDCKTTGKTWSPVLLTWTTGPTRTSWQVIRKHLGGGDCHPMGFGGGRQPDRHAPGTDRPGKGPLPCPIGLQRHSRSGCYSDGAIQIQRRRPNCQRNGASHRRRNCLHFDTSRVSSRDDHTDRKLSRTLARQHELRIGTVGAGGLGKSRRTITDASDGSYTSTKNSLAPDRNS